MNPRSKVGRHLALLAVIAMVMAACSTGTQTSTTAEGVTTTGAAVTTTASR